MQLEKDKNYNITVNGITYTFNITEGHKGFYLHFPGRPNDVLFCRHYIDKVKLAKETIGYYDYGSWPWCRTPEDCENLLYALLKELKDRTSCTCNFKLLNEINVWDD